jgi:beta-1,4-mannosyl-glycoprotein beta-1,4-N-acetylglucosaminyltransferase
MRIFDCFLFCAELDLLEIRLHELAPVVDRFVIAEATTTFSGLPKPLHYLTNRERFSAFANQIDHVVVDAPASADGSAWARQTRQRNALAEALVGSAPDDLVLLSDVDEIVSAAALAGVRRAPPRRGEVLCFELRMFNFFMNWECGMHWLRQGPRAVRKADLRSMQHLRRVRGPGLGAFNDLVRAASASWEMRRPVRRRVVADAGWHFSYMGGAAAVHEKLQSIAGHDRVPDDLKNEELVAARIAAGTKPISFSKAGLAFRELDAGFPAHLRNNRDRYAHLIAER